MDDPRFEELPGWTFTVREVSAGVFEVVARDPDGREVRRKGTDDNALLRQVRIDAINIQRRKPMKKGSTRIT